jgi:hypothetical protein
MGLCWHDDDENRHNSNLKNFSIDMKTFGHSRPVRDAAGEIVGQKESPARAVTREALGFNHAKKYRKPVIVALEAGDIITLRPQGTRWKVSARAIDVFDWIVRSQAMSANMAKLREKKAKKAVRLAQQRQARAERRLFRKE